MDFIKDAVSGAKGQKAEGQKEEGKKGESQDYLDKGVAFASSKAGFNISPENQEKATDFARETYEKTGNKVDPKISQ